MISRLPALLMVVPHKDHLVELQHSVIKLNPIFRAGYRSGQIFSLTYQGVVTGNLDGKVAHPATATRIENWIRIGRASLPLWLQRCWAL